MNRQKNVSYNFYIVIIALSLPLALACAAKAQGAKSAANTTSGGGTTAGAVAAPATDASKTSASESSDTALIPTPAPTATTPVPGAPRKKFVFKPGMELSIGTANETIKVTNDSKIAKAQVDSNPDSPEAHFVYAVALTRTSQVEEALKEIRTARKLSSAKGGAVYFDQMIGEYEEMLKNYPEDNQIRYHLAWAYYMKAYVLARYSKQVQKPATLPAVAANNAAGGKPAVAAAPVTPVNPPAGAQSKDWHTEFVAQNSVLKPEELADETEPSNKGTAEQKESDSKNPADAKDAKQQKKSKKPKDAKELSDNSSDSKDYVNLGEETEPAKTEAKKTTFTPPTVPPVNATAHGGNKNFWANPLGNLPNLGPITGMEYATANAAPEVIPQVKAYYRRALKKLDEVIEKEPDDMFANLYRAHLRAEYSGDIDSAMKVWESCRDAHPNSPAPYFFLGEGYLKKGNLGLCLTNVSKAIALRGTGN